MKEEQSRVIDVITLLALASAWPIDQAAKSLFPSVRGPRQ
jgi:hypothetical protein